MWRELYYDRRKKDSGGGKGWGMRPGLLIGIITLFLTSCNNGEQRAREERIAELTQQVETVQQRYDELSQQNQNLTESLRHEKDPYDSTISALRGEVLENRSFQRNSEILSSVTAALLWGSERELEEALDRELSAVSYGRNGARSYAVKERLNYIRHLYEQQLNEKKRSYRVNRIVYHDNATSNNHKDSAHQYLFEYLGDCLGASLGTPFQINNRETQSTEWLITLIREQLTRNQQDQLIDYLCKRSFSVMRSYWNESRADLELLQDGYEYVLETTKSVKYNAVIRENRFVNEEYEKGWNGIQKFFFRLERKFPGSAKRVLSNIAKEIESISKDHFAEPEIYSKGGAE